MWQVPEFPIYVNYGMNFNNKWNDLTLFFVFSF